MSLQAPPHRKIRASRALSAFLLLALGLGTVLRGAPPKAPVPLAEYLKIRRLAGASFNFDESLLAYVSNEGGRMDSGRARSAAVRRDKLTRVKGAIESFGFSPTSDVLVLEADIGGDELMQLYFTDSTGKEPVALFPKDPKGRPFRLRAVGRRRQDAALHVEPPRPESDGPLRVRPGNQGLHPDLAGRRAARAGHAQPRSRRFILNEELSDADTNCTCWSAARQTPRLLTPHSGEVMFAATDCSPDGRSLYYTSDQGRRVQLPACHGSR